MLVHSGRVAAVVDLRAAECAEIAATAKKQLLAAAAAALGPEVKWDSVKHVCVRREGKVAELLLDATQSDGKRLRPDVGCSRRSAAEPWTCNEVGSNVVLQIDAREVLVDPDIPAADAKKIATFFVRYSGPELSISYCDEPHTSRFTAKTLGQLQNIYIDLDQTLAVTLTHGRLALNRDALSKTGKVEIDC